MKLNSNLVIEIIELCEVDTDGNDGKATGLRTIVYQTSQSTLENAINEYVNDFDWSKLLETNDDFEGTCLNSMEISVRALHNITD